MPVTSFLCERLETPIALFSFFFTRVTISGEKNAYLRNMRSFVWMICILFYSNVANRTFLFIVILSIYISPSF